MVRRCLLNGLLMEECHQVTFPVSFGFEAWYFGHFHEDTSIEDEFFCLYDELIIID